MEEGGKEGRIYGEKECREERRNEGKEEREERR